jgi:hypothetical protein
MPAAESPAELLNSCFIISVHNGDSLFRGLRREKTKLNTGNIRKNIKPIKNH